MSVIQVRNTSLRDIGSGLPLTADFVSDTVIDFRDSKCGSIQIVREGGDKNDGIFSLLWSDICDPSTFIPFPESGLVCSETASVGWIFNVIPFRYMMVKYVKGTDSTGTAAIYAVGKR